MNNELGKDLTALAKEQVSTLSRLINSVESMAGRMAHMEATLLAQRGAIYSLIRSHHNPPCIFESFTDYLDIQLKDADPTFVTLVQTELHKIQTQIVRSVNSRSQGE